MRSLSQAAVLLALSFSVASLAGCNSLTEPSEFRVVKETPKQQPAAPEAKAPGQALPGGAVLGGGAADKGPEGNVRAANEMPKRPMPAMQAPPARPANAGSCGE
jgi:hypothetical protein